ncbi:serine hydrolase domain-containing protein [Nakamurella sp. GG22]
MADGGDLFDPIWAVPEAQVTDGRLPGYAAAVRIGGRVATRVGGRMSFDAGSAPVSDRALFRIASLTKPIGAALALTLIQDGTVALDDPIARWIPEAAHPRVLQEPDGVLDSTVAVDRPITVRDLPAGTSGWGAVLAENALQRRMIELGVYPGAITPDVTADEFVARVTALPLAFQPGAGWLYHTGMDLLGVLLVRASGQSLPDLLAERVTGPLGMESTVFWTAEVDRLPVAYEGKPGEVRVLDMPDGHFTARSAGGAPTYEALASGLLSTIGDLLRFFCAMADGGGPVLTAESVAEMTSDALTETQRASGVPLLGPGESWGLGTGVDIDATEQWKSVGRWGWAGGTGTIAYVDPVRDTVSILLTQRGIEGAADLFEPFWAAVAGASDALRPGDQPARSANLE